jgi:CheY-like chemotaxis protein/DNA-binding Xre family transcriptional regulator
MNSTDARASFASAVKAWRSRLGISQEELAGRAGLHRTYVSDIERGARNLSLESIEKLARALETSVSSLFSSASSAEGNSLFEVPDELVDILLVEDDLDDVEIAMRAFKRAKISNRIHVVRDGAEALTWLFGGGPDAQRRVFRHPQLILLDLNLPKVTGLEVLRRIKSDERTREIPVIVLTASQNDRDVAESRRLGASTYLVKPLDFQRFSQVTPQLSMHWALVGPSPTHRPSA